LASSESNQQLGIIIPETAKIPENAEIVMKYDCGVDKTSVSEYVSNSL